MVEPFNARSVGYHVFLSSVKKPSDAVIFFQSPSVTLSFFNGRHASPIPSKMPLPVMAIFSKSTPEIGGCTR